MPGNQTVNREALETRLSCFGRAVRNGRTTFHSFREDDLLAKNIARTAIIQLDGRRLLFGVYCRTKNPFIS